MNIGELKATVFYNIGELIYNFSFPYIKKEFIKVKYVDKLEADYIDEGLELEYNKDYKIYGNKVQLINSNVTYNYICIYRKTTNKLITVFKDSSLLKSFDMNISNIQLLHLYEELNDYAVIHKIPKGLLKQIQDAIDITTNNVLISDDILKDIINKYELINNKVNEAIIVTESINVKSFDDINDMINSNNITINNLIRTKGYNKKLDNKGALYTVEASPKYNNDYIKISNNLYAIKIKDDIDTNSIIYNNINIDSIIQSYIEFYHLDNYLVFPNHNFIINNILFCKNNMLNISYDKNVLQITIKKEGR